MMPRDSANGRFRALRPGIGTPRECQVRAGRINLVSWPTDAMG